MALGRALAGELHGAVLLIGNLGAGKTTLAKGIVEGRGVAGADAVSSPTFTLIHQYGEDDPVYHIDLYRIHSEKDAIDIGLEEYLPGDGVTVIEWPDRIASILPPQTRHWELEVVSLTERVIRQIEEPAAS